MASPHNFWQRFMHKNAPSRDNGESFGNNDIVYIDYNYNYKV